MDVQAELSTKKKRGKEAVRQFHKRQKEKEQPDKEKAERLRKENLELESRVASYQQVPKISQFLLRLSQVVSPQSSNSLWRFLSNCFTFYNLLIGVLPVATLAIVHILYTMYRSPQACNFVVSFHSCDLLSQLPKTTFLFCPILIFIRS